MRWGLGPRYAVAWTNEHGPWRVLWNSTHRSKADARKTLDAFVMFNYIKTMKEPATHFGIWDLKRDRIIEVTRL